MSGVVPGVSCHVLVAQAEVKSCFFFVFFLMAALVGFIVPQTCLQTCSWRMLAAASNILKVYKGSMCVHASTTLDSSGLVCSLHLLHHRFDSISVQLKTTNPQRKALLCNLLHLTDLGKFEKFVESCFDSSTSQILSWTVNIQRSISEQEMCHSLPELKAERLVNEMHGVVLTQVCVS